MDSGTTLGLAIIPPLLAIFFEVVNPIRDRFAESSVEQDFEEFRCLFQHTTTPGAATQDTGTQNTATPDATLPDFDHLIETASGSTKAAIEVSMLAVTGVSVITSGFAIIHEFKEPYWPAIFYVIFFVGAALFLWSLLAGYTLFHIDEGAGWRPSLRNWRRSFSRSQIIEATIYVLNALLIIFALCVLEFPNTWVTFFEIYRLLFFVVLACLICISLLISYVSGAHTLFRRTAILVAVFAATAIVTIEIRTGSRLANAMTSFTGSGLGPNPGSSTGSGAQVEPAETQLGYVGATLLAIQKTLELIEQEVSKAEAAQSGLKKSLEEIDAQLLDMRIAQPVDLSYLAGADCRRVQQALRELAVYRGQVDGKCDGATNAAAREWQISERRTIAPAHSGDQIERTLRAGAGLR